MSEVSLSKIENMIYMVRGQRVMMDSDLADLYEVETKQLNRQGRRNILKFHQDFMFQLSFDEFREIQKLKSKLDQYGSQRKSPYVFTENGVAMLPSILNSDKAILINIAIIRIFNNLRRFLLLEKGLSERISRLESGTNKTYKVVIERLDVIELIVDAKLPSTKKKIGTSRS